MSHWYDSTLKKSRRRRESNPGSSALEADALTTRPTRRTANWGPVASQILRSGAGLATPSGDHLIGLVVKASASRAQDPGFESRLGWDFSGWSHTSDLTIGTPLATLTGAWHYTISAGTGWPGVSIL